MIQTKLAAAATPTPEFNNASMAIQNGFASSEGLVPIIGAVIAVAVVIFGLSASAGFYRWALETSQLFARSLEYAIKGVATAFIIAVFATPVYLFAQVDGQTRGLVYQAIAAIILGYLGLVVLGFVGDQVWQRLMAQHEEVTSSRPLESSEEVDG